MASKDPLKILDFYSNTGKGINDLGNYDQCRYGTYANDMHYCLANIAIPTSTQLISTYMGFCIPKDCTPTVLYIYYYM